MKHRIALPFLMAWMLAVVGTAQSLSQRARVKVHTDENTRFAPDFGLLADVMKGGVLVDVNEAWQGQDLNGDGQIGDVVLVAFELG